MKLLILLAILLLASSCHGECLQSILVFSGDTCESINDNNPNGISMDEFMALNPNIDCDNLEPGSQACLAGDLPESDNNNNSGQEPSSDENSQGSSDQEQSNPPEESDQNQEPTSDGDAGAQNSSDQEQSSVPEQTDEEPQNSSDNQQSVSEEPTEVSESQNQAEPTASEQEENSSPSEAVGNPSDEESVPSDAEEYDPFIQEVLAIHQYYRDFVGSPPLVWNYTLNASAYSWVQHDMEINDFSHSISLGAFEKYGENIAVGFGYYYDNTGRHSASYNATQLYHLLIDPEWQKFNNGTRIFDDTCSTTGHWQDVAHYTQVIWATSTSVGCGITQSGDTTAMVCQYYPSGNRVNQYIY